MSDVASRLRSNLSRVRERMAVACSRAGRLPDDVTLVPVIKYASWECMLGLVDLGITVLAENRPQQLLERAARLSADRPEASRGIAWHLVGHLQRNKVRAVLPAVGMIHSVDSVRLLQRIDDIAAELDVSPRVLLEVNVSGEASKDGFTPDELRAAWSKVESVRHVQVAGLMTMAPYADDSDTSRPTFRGLRQLRDDLRKPGSPHPLTHLSMGMSGDFETAIEEGATLVRIGSLLFEGLETTDPRP